MQPEHDILPRLKQGKVEVYAKLETEEDILYL